MTTLRSFFLSLQHTATADTKFRLVNADLWFRDLNIHITGNDADYGDYSNQDAQVASGGVLSFQNVNLADIFFKNHAAGSNTVITAVGALMLPGQKRQLGISEAGVQ